MIRACLVLMAVLPVAACSPEMNWREWRSDEVDLSQLFPCRPIRQQRSLALAGRDVVLVLQVCDAGQVSWSVAYANVLDPAAVDASLQALIDAAHANLGAVPARVRAEAVPGATPQATAGRFVVHGRAPDGRSLDGTFMVFAKGTQVVQVTTLGARLPDDMVEIFLGSTRVRP